MLLTQNHEWSPPVLPLHPYTHAPACHHLPMVSPEHSNDGEEESGALNISEPFSQEPYYIHDKMIDASQVLMLFMILYWKMMCPSS